MNVGDKVILVHPEKDCHKGMVAEIVRKIIDNCGVAIYRVKICGQKKCLKGYATDDDLKIQP